MCDKEIKIAKIKNDIREIDDVFQAQVFDRKKAEDIIRKHNITDEVIGAFNSPMNPKSRPFYMLHEDVIKTNLVLIREYLIIKLAKESGNGQA